MQSLTSEETRLLDRARGEARRAERTGRAVCGKCIPLSQQHLIAQAANESGIAYSVCGGWPDAERVQYCLHPEDTAPVFSGVWLHVSWNARFSSPSHRDLLGSLMGLGMDRDLFGDLLVEDGHAYVFALPELARRLPVEWQSAGHAALTVEEMDTPPSIQPPQGTALRMTVSSPRLDAILSDSLHLSRARSADLIRAGHVSLNHREELRTDRILHPGDLLSVRGFGRVRIDSIGEETRKGRLPVMCTLFSSKTSL